MQRDISKTTESLASSMQKTAYSTFKVLHALACSISARPHRPRSPAMLPIPTCGFPNYSRALPPRKS